MANYNRDNRSGGGNRNFGNPRFRNDRNDRQEMFSATCANCGKQCEVPFRPTGSKPVLCRDCFKNNRSDFARPERRSFDRPQSSREDSPSRPDYQAQFDALNAKMDKILSLLTPQPTEVAPLESEISEETIDEIAEEVLEEKEDTEKKKTTKKKSSPKKKKE
ncbi:MAG TPA: CxxC-x17-CxxC domain-containing protein [Candidatus Saccharimonadales bacterium]|nr:CxxC-x17-CxxC domain-containing protein [Candidatus Saccharimonadales bacterium]